MCAVFEAEAMAVASEQGTILEIMPAVDYLNSIGEHQVAPLVDGIDALCRGESYFKAASCVQSPFRCVALSAADVC